MEIKSLSKLNSNEKTSIEQLVFICNTFVIYADFWLQTCYRLVSKK